MLNSKLKTLNSKQTQIFKTQNSKPRNLLSFVFLICLEFRVYCLEFKSFGLPAACRDFVLRIEYF